MQDRVAGMSSSIALDRSPWLWRRPGAVNLFEIALMVVAYRFIWRFPYPNITIDHAAWMRALFGVWIPATFPSWPSYDLGAIVNASLDSP